MKPDLFDDYMPKWGNDITPLARATDPTTSHVSAAEFSNSAALKLDTESAFKAVKENPGLTAAELEQKLQVKDGKIRKRLSSLCDVHGLIRRGPARKCRVTGKTAQTWEVV